MEKIEKHHAQTRMNTTYYFFINTHSQSRNPHSASKGTASYFSRTTHSQLHNTYSLVVFGKLVIDERLTRQLMTMNT